MDFLDIPIIKALLMVIALIMLARWLFDLYPSLLKTKANNLTSRGIETMIDQLSESDLSKIQIALDGNRNIEAIKLFRAATNAGLLDAKNAIGHMIQRREHVK